MDIKPAVNVIECYTARRPPSFTHDTGYLVPVVLRIQRPGKGRADSDGLSIKHRCHRVRTRITGLGRRLNDLRRRVVRRRFRTPVLRACYPPDLVVVAVAYV